VTTKDQRYYDSMISAVNWAMRYDWQGNALSRGPEWAARISIGLSAALPQITTGVASTVRNRIDTIAPSASTAANGVLVHFTG
jgi:hypothetical protein